MTKEVLVTISGLQFSPETESESVELITDTPHDFGGGTDLPGYSVAIWKMEH